MSIAEEEERGKREEKDGEEDMGKREEEDMGKREVHWEDWLRWSMCHELVVKI